MVAPQFKPSFEESVEPGVWRYVRADRLTVLIDAEEYFREIQRAMLNVRDLAHSQKQKARHQTARLGLLVSAVFHARIDGIRLAPNGNPQANPVQE